MFQSGFYQRGAGEQAAYPAGFLGFPSYNQAAAAAAARSGQDSPFSDPAGVSKLYPSSGDVSPAGYKGVDCAKDSGGGYGAKDLGAAWPAGAGAVGGAAGVGAAVGAGRFAVDAGVSQEQRQRLGQQAASSWLAACSQGTAQHGAQLTQQAGQYPASTPIYPWMAMAGERRTGRGCRRHAAHSTVRWKGSEGSKQTKHTTQKLTPW